MTKSVYRACGPEHLRASRTFYRLELPLATTPSVSLRAIHIIQSIGIAIIMIEVSLVIEINQKNQSTHFPKAMHYVKKAQNQERAAVCLSSLCSALVSFPVLSQIKPHDPLLVVPLPSIPLNFSIATILSPESRLFDFSQCAPLDEYDLLLHKSKMYKTNP